MGYATTVSQPIQVTRADTLTVRFGVQVRAVLLDPLPRGDDAYNALVWGILHRACPRPLVLAPTLARITILGRSGCGLGLTLTS